MSRTLIVYKDGNGDFRAAMLDHDEADLFMNAAARNQVTQLVDGFRVTEGAVLIDMPTDDFRPLIWDDDGREVPLVYHDI